MIIPKRKIYDISSPAKPKGANCKSFRELYVAWSNVHVLPTEFEKVPYELLDPKMLARLGKPDISAIIAHDCFPFLLQASIKMRSTGNNIKGLQGKELITGADIPPIRVMTMEVRFRSSDQNSHDSIYRCLAEILHKCPPEDEEDDPAWVPFGSADDEGRRHMGGPSASLKK